MAESNVTSLGLEALRNRSRDTQRPRPPDINILTSENKVPLRSSKLAKRDSKIGLRNIFGKSKLGKDDKIVEEVPSTRETSKHGGIRNSIADISNWSHRLHASRSEVTLLNSPTTSRPSTIVSPSHSYQSRQSSNGSSRGKSHQPAVPKTRSSMNTFDLPPLFKMYPQAIKHVRLPTCVTPIDTLERLSESKSSSLQNNFSRSDVSLDHYGVHGIDDRKVDGEKKKKTKFTPEWTSKIYALVTSGYLLQYAAEGPTHRLPEKVLHLTRDSAAYVTDLIPGKQYVVRVASSTDSEGNASSDTKSLKTKFALRGIEKRQVSNMLLVFQSAETMDAWLAILRREIELLGGRKKLSETGEPETDEDDAMLRTQASQRTLVVRDPDRFSHIVSQDLSWSQEHALVDPSEESDMAEARLGRMSGSTMDDGSSVISADGQHLESLRHSGSDSSGNRLSFISSGQRTVVSSAESSPTTSPVRASFSSYGDDYLDQLSQKALPPLPEIRPRPNAAEIVNRRQSMQQFMNTTIPTSDPHHDAISRSPPLPSLPNHDAKQQFVPNFSVPHTVNRRYSAMTLSTPASKPERSRTVDQDGPIRPIRRSPPTTLAISRPLSIVLDQPSPLTPSPPIVPATRGPALQALDTPSMFGPWDGGALNPELLEKTTIPRSLLSRRMTDEPQLGGKATSVWSQGQYDARTTQQDMKHLRLDPDKSYIVRPARARPAVTTEPQEPLRRATSSLEMRRVSTTPIIRQPSHKHINSIAEIPSSRSRHSMAYSRQSSAPFIKEPSYTLAPSPIFTPKRSVPSLRASHQETSSKQFLSVDISARGLSTRRSMPTLAEGPPPAPPPTCALPPIPRKRSSVMVRTIKT